MVNENGEKSLRGKQRYYIKNNEIVATIKPVSFGVSLASLIMSL